MRRTALLMWWPGLALGLSVAFLVGGGTASDRLAGPWPGVLSVLLTWSVALALRLRYPTRPLAGLLFLLGGLHALAVLLGHTNQALPFTVSRLLRPVVEWLLIWVLLAFPSGRVSSLLDRGILGFGAALIVVAWLPSLLMSPSFPLPGSWVRCGSECPENLLFLWDRPQHADLALAVFRAGGALTLLATTARLAYRLWQATPLMRRVIVPVQLAALLRTFSMLLFVSGGVHPWAMVLSFWAIPLAMVLGLLRGRLWIARALEQLVSGLRSLPDRQALRDCVASALADPSLQIGYWVPGRAGWVDAWGQALAQPDAGDCARAAHVMRDERGEAVALLVFDAALLEEPDLVALVADSMRMALVRQQLETLLEQSRRDAADAATSARVRIERDLHDGAQQRLIALRLKVGVVQRLLDQDTTRAANLLEELGPDIDGALQEIREIAHGAAPALLDQEGLAVALRDLVRRCGRGVILDVQDPGRLAPALEQALYFSACEALQNACKHAPAGARLALTLAVAPDGLRLGMTSVGPAPLDLRLPHLQQRLAAVGGRLELLPLDGGGLCVQAWVGLPH